ncbi:ionotropic receptor 21a-like isoform 2-T2 [Cochliomyia hominivorax]
MLLVQENYWSVVINILVQKYFTGLTTTCVLWSENLDFDLTTSYDSKITFLQINPENVAESFAKDVYDFSIREKRDNSNGVYYSDFIKKLIAAIEHSHCEGFLVLQENISLFAKAFKKASVYAIWRSINSKFIFAYHKEQQSEAYFQDSIFKNQPNILVIEADSYDTSTFILKTNKFVGPNSQNPKELLFLSTFYAPNKTFMPDINLSSLNKLRNLQGREIIVGVFDYRPFVAVDFERYPQYHDRAENNPKHLVHVDGTEVRICHTFCKMYNCSVEFDTAAGDEWGLGYNNYSGYGLVRKLIEGEIHMAMEASYAVHSDYAVIDMTTFIGRSGVTCLVPKASNLVSWDLPLRPFHLTLWLAIMAGLCLETCVLFLSHKFEENTLSHPNSWWSSFEFGYVTSLKLFINQNSHYLVQSHTVRVFLFSCYMVDTILTSVYGGGLSAILTIPTFGESADTVEKLIEFNLTWTGSSYAWIESLISTEMDVSQYLKIFDEMRSKAKTHNMAFILERLAFGHFGGGDFITPESLARLKLMRDEIFNQYTVALVPRLWPHLPLYNDLILMWHSSGLDKYWEWKCTAEYLNVNEQSQVENSKYTDYNMGPAKLNLENFAGLVILWVAGMSFSMIVFVGELLWFRWEKRREKKKLRNIKCVTITRLYYLKDH